MKKSNDGKRRNKHGQEKVTRPRRFRSAPRAKGAGTVGTTTARGGTLRRPACIPSRGNPDTHPLQPTGELRGEPRGGNRDTCQVTLKHAFQTPILLSRSFVAEMCRRRRWRESSRAGACAALQASATRPTCRTRSHSPPFPISFTPVQSLPSRIPSSRARGWRCGRSTAAWAGCARPARSQRPTSRRTLSRSGPTGRIKTVDTRVPL